MEEKLKAFASRVEKKARQLKVVYMDAGIHGLIDVIDNDLNEWKKERIQIAVTGEAGSGKSTFINAIRGLTAEMEGGAPVGSTTTTTEPTPYAHPHNPNFLLWDLPGIGTDGYPEETYLTKIKLAEYDSFIILSCKRFTTNDEFLAREIEEAGKPFYFVRTQFGNDIDNESSKKKGKPVNERKLKGEILKDCERNLANLKNLDDIFVIDSYKKDYYDFNLLAKRLICDFEKTNEKKQVALILTLSAMTAQAIEEKKATLEKRIAGTALKAAFAPSISGSDMKVLMEEKDFYKKQFGLDEKSLERDADASSIRHQLKDIASKVEQKEDTSVVDANLSNAIEKCIPFLTCFYNIYKTYSAGKVWLKQTLDNLAESALDVNKTMVEGVAKDKFATSTRL